MNKLKEKLASKGLKATVQRLYVYEALLNSRQHPTAEEVYLEVSRVLPSVSLSTIYNTLETFVEHKLVNKVHNDTGIARYDAFVETHHHIYSENGEIIADYYDEKLAELLNDYFTKKKINGYEIKEIRLQIICSTKEKETKNE